MILPMAKVRILGPRSLLPTLLPVLQDFGKLHVTPPPETGGVTLVESAPAGERRERHRQRVLHAVRRALQELHAPEPEQVGVIPALDRPTLARWSRRARRIATEARSLRERRADLDEEQALLTRYRQLYGTFRELVESAGRWPEAAAYHVILPGGEDPPLALLRDGLREILGEEFEIWPRKLDTGETAALILVSQPQQERLEELFRSIRVQEVELPGAAEGLSPAEAIPKLLERLDGITEELKEVETQRERLSRRHLAGLRAVEAGLMDELVRIEMTTHAGETDHAFVVEGWVPTRQRAVLDRELRNALGETTILEEVSREEWVGEDVPVVLHNPRLFRPFEKLVAILPLPRYGSIDPTPFLAIFFPMFFGLVLGDVAYGVILEVISLALLRGAESGSTRRAIAEIGGACSAFTIVFGLLYGELFGDLGASLFGMRALALHREEALLPFLALAISIGVVHIALGLLLGFVSGLRQGGKASVGPGVTLLMVVLIVVGLLAAVGVLPAGVFTPAALAVLVLFPVLVVVEGIIGPTELLTTLGHVLSYARVMAVGTASVMMAVAANRMVGAVGSVLVGSVFALLFHLVNFALGVFSPTVHALRLHFVEFFGTFYSPGGTRYDPFGHWAGSQDREE
jgi:V/A-type H+-transporting ATPase subunit I